MVRTSTTSIKPKVIPFKKTAKQVEAIELLAGEATHILLYGGSRSAKTFTLLRAMVIRALRVAESRHLVVRYRFNHAKQSIWYDTFPKMMRLCFPEVQYAQNKSDWFYRFPNGSEIWIGGLDDKERTEKILGNEYATIFFNECSQISYDSVTTALSRLAQNTALYNKAYYDENPPNKKHWSYLYFILGIDPESRLPLPKNLTAHLQMNPKDNQENLPKTYIDNVLANMPHRKRKRFLEGEFADDNEKALWSRRIIDPYRITADQVPFLSRIVVAIDPATTAKPESDETGIITVGEGRALPGFQNPHLSHYYVLNDLTQRSKYYNWGRDAVDEFYRQQADRIVAEVNQGGDLVEGNIRNIDPNVPYSGVHATRGKMVRAEPISALYEQGRVHHITEFLELEDEMCSYEYSNNEPSPNRLDALVWGLTELSGLQNMEVQPVRNQRSEKTRSKVRDLPL